LLCGGITLVPLGELLAQTNLTAGQIKQVSNAKLFRVNTQNEGIFLQVSGNPQIKLERTGQPTRIVIDLQGTEVVPELRNAVIPYNRLGVSQIRIAQNQPNTVRVVLDLIPSDPLSNSEWQAFNAGGGTVFLKPTGAIATPNPNPNPIPTAKTQVVGINASVTGLLAIQTDRPASYRLLQQGNTYILDIANASFSYDLARPNTLPANSPIERIRVDEIGDTVRISVSVDPNWIIREGERVATQINLQLSQSASIPPVANRGRGLIIIDPGHGGRDPGAIGNGVQEKDLVLPLSLRLGRILQGMGYGVQYTRTTDVEIDLEPRVQFAEQLRGDVFISIHANSLASGNPEVGGVETYYSPGSSGGFALANLVHPQIIAATGARDRGVRSARFYVIRRTTMPSILLETGFVTNPTEAANLNNPAYQERMAQAIARGIDQFLRTYRR
jgi:N-acetylmuramoyl-L-alanine amidase